MKIEIKEVKQKFLDKLSKLLPQDCKSYLEICSLIFDNIRLEYQNTTIQIPKDYKIAIEDIFKNNGFKLNKQDCNCSQYSAEVGDIYSIYSIYWNRFLLEHYVDGSLVFRIQCKNLQEMYDNIKGLF